MRISRARILITAAVALIAAAGIILPFLKGGDRFAGRDLEILRPSGTPFTKGGINPPHPLYERGNNTKEEYRSDKFGFTFEYPAGAEIAEIREGETFVILLTSNIQHPITSQLQIAITPFDEDIVLTEARIRADLPAMPMQDARPARLGSAEGVRFTNDTNELWAVWNGYLYQLKALEKDAALLETIAKGWEN